MSTVRAGSRSASYWAVAAAATAAALGGLAAIDVTVMAAVTGAAAIGLALASRPKLILPFLAGSIFVEAIAIGGVTISRLLAPTALLVLLAVASRERISLRVAPPLAWAIAYSLWAVVSGFWSVNFGATTTYLGSLAIALTYMVAIGALLDSEANLRRVGLAFAFAALALGLFAITDFLFQLGLTLEAGRAAGAAGDPNYFAAYQVIALPVTLALSTYARSPTLRFALYAAAVVIIVSVFTSVSRGGLLTLIAVSLLAFLLPARALFRSPAQKVAVLLVFLVGLGFAYQSAAEQIAPRFRTLVERDATGSGRTGLWMAGWTAISERPVLGLGFGSFPSSANDLILRTPGIDLRHYELRPEGHEVHNMYISTAAELGIPGLVFLLGVIVAAGREFRRAAVQAAEVGRPFIARMSTAMLVSLVGFAFASIFLSTETSRGLWILIGLSLALPKVADPKRDQLPSDALQSER